MPGTPAANSRKGKVAALLATGRFTDLQIAEKLGISRATVTRYKLDPAVEEMRKRLADEHAERAARALSGYDIAQKHLRVGVLDDLHKRHLQVIDIRAKRYGHLLKEVAAADEAEPQIELTEEDETARARREADNRRSAIRRKLNADPPPEAATGLYVRKETVNAAGWSSIEWEHDTGLIKEIRALEEQAAKELGQIVDKQDVTVGGSLQREYIVVMPDDEDAS